VTRPEASLGAAIAGLVASAVHHVIMSVLPEHHAERMRQQVQLWQSVVDSTHHQLRPIARHCLDTGAVHPLLEPIFRAMAGE
jgi:hypothetical protein